MGVRGVQGVGVGGGGVCNHQAPIWQLESLCSMIQPVLGAEAIDSDDVEQGGRRGGFLLETVVLWADTDLGDGSGLG